MRDFPVLTGSFVAGALGLTIAPNVNFLTFSSITTDSRKISPGCLFVALKGDNFDGHDFIETAFKGGAAAVIAEKGRAAAHSPVFEVPDTQRAYHQLGRAWRNEFSLPVVLIAGSNGKTTTKEILHAMLGGKWSHVLKTEGSQNGWVGIPLTLLRLTPSHQAAVIEVGIDEPGAMIEHVRCVQPTAAVITAIGPEHLEKLRDLKTVAHEEGIALSETARLGGLIAVQLDDPSIASHLGASKTALGYTLHSQQAEPAWSLDSTASGTRVLVGKVGSDKKSIEINGARFDLPLLGRHNAMNMLSAYAVATLLGLSSDEIRQGLARFQGAEARSQIKAIGQTQIICDYYNSQPASLQAGLALLAEIGSAGKRWACLADMLELGQDEEKFHRDAADWISEYGITRVALYGKRMKWLEDELKKRSFTGQVSHHETQAELGERIASELKRTPGASVLVKGSRGMKMENAFNKLAEVLNEK